MASTDEPTEKIENEVIEVKEEKKVVRMKIPPPKLIGSSPFYFFRYLVSYQQTTYDFSTDLISSLLSSLIPQFHPLNETHHISSYRFLVKIVVRSTFQLTITATVAEPEVVEKPKVAAPRRKSRISIVTQPVTPPVEK